MYRNVQKRKHKLSAEKCTKKGTSTVEEEVDKGVQTIRGGEEEFKKRMHQLLWEKRTNNGASATVLVNL